MARRAPRTFTPEFEAKVVLDVLTGTATQAEVCRKHQISPTLFGPWKATLLDRLSSVFQADHERSAEPGTRERSGGGRGWSGRTRGMVHRATRPSDVYSRRVAGDAPGIALFIHADGAKKRFGGVSAWDVTSAPK